MNTKRNDPFGDNTKRPFGTPKPKVPEAKLPSLPQPPQKLIPTAGSVTVPQLPNFTKPSVPQEDGAVQEPQLPAAPNFGNPTFLPGIRKPSRGSTTDLFPEANPYIEPEVEDIEAEEAEETQLTDAELYDEVFGEKMPDNWVGDKTVTDAEDELLARRFESSVSPAALPTLYALASDSDWRVRENVAANEDTPVALLEILSNDVDSMVRQNVMENPACSEAVYRKFWEDEDDDIIVDWIEFERTTEEMLRPLYDTDDDFIASMLIESPLVPEDIIAYLTKKHDL